MGRRFPIHATFTDETGTERIVHSRGDGGPLRLKQERTTEVILLNRAANRLIGAKVKAAREAAGMSQSTLCQRSGMKAASPRQGRLRIHAIENIRPGGEGMRHGSLFAIAAALGIEATTLMPTVEEVMREAGVSFVSPETIGVTSDAR